jgi:hypothetical protein
MVTGEEVHQLSGHQGNRFGRKNLGNTWAEAPRDLVKNIYVIPGSILP